MICYCCKQDLPEEEFQWCRKKRIDTCKKCAAQAVDNGSYLSLLERNDIGYSKTMWKEVEDTVVNRRKQLPSSTIFLYLGRMNLASFRGYTWNDSEALEEINRWWHRREVKNSG